MKQFFQPARWGCSLAALAGAAASVAACSATSAPPPSATAERSSAPPASASIDNLKALVGNAACETDDDCATLPLGARACGGPEGYLPWSRRATDGALLANLAERYADRRRADVVRQPDRASTCQVVPDPGAQCTSRTPIGNATSERIGPRGRACALRAVTPVTGQGSAR